MGAAAAAAAAGFHPQTTAAAGWNYPHPGQYPAGLTGSSMDEAARARAAQAAMDATSFHSAAADYSRLQYPHETGIYTHPPGTYSARR